MSILMKNSNKKRLLAKQNPDIVKALSSIWSLFEKDFMSKIECKQFTMFMKMAYKL